MITAKEAGKKSNNAIKQREAEMQQLIDQCIPTIEVAINNAAENGLISLDIEHYKFPIALSLELIHSLCDMLRHNGYVVSVCPIQEIITISWHKESQIYTKRL
jgi:site-specific recombinase